MELRYYINATQISEPIGFDDFKTILKRTKQHGVSAESSVGELEFDGVGFGIIQTAYNTDIDTELIFKAEIKCTASDDWETLYTGLIDLSTYTEQYTDYCSCKVSVGEIGIKTTFNNRIETEVAVSDSLSTDLDGNAFDYFSCTNFMVMPVKKIFLTSSGLSTGDQLEIAWNPPMQTAGLEYPMGNELIAEMSGFEGSDEWAGTSSFFKNLADSTVNFLFRGVLQFAISNTTSFGAPGVNNFLSSVYLRFATPSIVKEYNLTSQINAASHQSNFTVDVDFFQSLTTLQTIRCYLDVQYNTVNWVSGLRINYFNEAKEFRIYKEDVSNASTFTPFLIHETFNKLSKHLSGLSVKSDWFGRFNSAVNPLAEETVGDGAMKVLISGLGIRNRAGVLNTSFKNLFKNLNAIDNLGWGFSNEDETDYIRVENWKWFYNSNVLISIDNPANKKRTLQTDNVYTRIQTGYKKSFAVEEINAIDSFHGIENRSSTLKAIDNEMNAVSDYIADPFAIEMTRRAGLALALDTKDWKYDDNIFVVAIKMNIDGLMSVEQGAENEDKTFLSPETMTNVRLSPIRNTLRFIDLLSNSVQKKDFVFTSGTGNTSAVCSPIAEAGYYYLDGGNEDLLYETETISNVTGLLKPELIEFEYPLTLAEYKYILSDPYGIITVDSEDCYLQELIRKPLTGECQFKVIPKI